MASISVLDEMYCGFRIFGDFLPGFSVSNRPLYTPSKSTVQSPRKKGVLITQNHWQTITIEPIYLSREGLKLGDSFAQTKKEQKLRKGRM